MRLSKLSALRLLPTLILGGICITAVFSGAAALSAWRAASAPHVGDMIAFHPTRATSAGKRLTVLTRAGSTCALELGTLQGSGGSFIVERPAPGDRFIVHWAGQRTSRGNEDCGPSADVLLDAQQLGMLGTAALASGGQSIAGA
jgi:hypothetical protein